MRNVQAKFLGLFLSLMVSGQGTATLSAEDVTQGAAAGAVAGVVSRAGDGQGIDGALGSGLK
ncbi:MAG: hypothetical protein HY547_06205 [Elusimicrobia bacterium]|nr:hypothetical protein [Elusimicrobiota bacterium]